jgi:JmjC domain.
LLITEITVPVLVAESVFSSCGWTKDDHGFHTLAYLHAGCDKIWYVIPQQYLRNVITSILHSFDENSFITPNELIKQGYPVHRCIQKEGQYVVIEPGCFYFTISTGYCLSEVVKFAPLNWFESLNGFNFERDAFIEVRMLLNYVMDCFAKDMCPYKPIILQKLKLLNSFVTTSISKISNVGIQKIKYAKNISYEFSKCYDCDAVCYVVLMALEKKKVTLCVNHAIQFMKGDQSHEDIPYAIVLVSPSKISQFIDRLNKITI